MIFLIPGDAATYMAGLSATAEQVASLRQQLGLNDPIWAQYFRFLGGILHGHFGRSLYTQQPVLEVVFQRLPQSWLLATVSIIFSVLIGVPAGVFSAVKRDSLLDHLMSVVLLFGYSMPGFWLGLMVILLFSLYLGWLPPTGSGGLQHIVLPTVALGASTAASIARMTRSSFLEVLSQDYMRTARSKGLPQFILLRRHALKNSLIAVVTIIGTQFSTLIGRSVVIESVFAWPGVGRLLLDAINTRDIPLVEGIVFFIALSVIVLNLLVDSSYAWLDPRVHYT